MRTRTFVLALAFGASGCAVGRQWIASPADLGDYRAFRTAAHTGVRLSHAARYLRNHPDGVFAAEVKEAFALEEAEYFERAKESRAAAREYLVDLPDGPHADAAFARLTTFEGTVDDYETATLVGDAKRTESVLARAAEQRKAMVERLVTFVAALVDDDTYGRPIGEGPAVLKRALGGTYAPTWGEVPRQRTEDLFYSVPVAGGRESRVLTVRFEVTTAKNVVVAGALEGQDLVDAWAEAEGVRAVDRDDAKSRRRADLRVVEVLSGVLEAHLPASTCAKEPADGELLVRACRGFSFVVRRGTRTGDGPKSPDRVEVRGPAGNRPL
ncbi:MAG: hypothetical protein U0169_13980 [Polyangiaceae bacterium]